MSTKKRLGLGLATAALGLSLIGGGTYAYFSDTADVQAKFANGTLVLNAQPTTIIDVNNLKPGDWMNRSFKLKNAGSLDIHKILLKTTYNVIDANGNNTEDFGKHIRVNFLLNGDKIDTIIFWTTLDQLKTMTPDAIENDIFIPWLEERGGKLPAGTSDELYVQFQFVENHQDQNQFQGDKLDLTWTFEGYQGHGVEK
ncbi:CalY family protein [Neobacillus sp. FSL H8-0543]|uniref:CalY family protein n=1 Tax=Neobacillus sp. FSL H8-0543 TaxID=2954672 RepID=UPI003158070D